MATEKKITAKKPVTGKVTAKKVAKKTAKKVTTKKSTAKKVVTKKPQAKKPATKKTTSKTKAKDSGLGEKSSRENFVPEVSTLVKADFTKRLVAKFIDLLICYIFVEIGNISGFLLAITYILASDGFAGGSIGKRLIGVSVVTRVTKRPVNLMESAIRNSIFAAVIIVYFTIGFIPYVGKLIALASVIAIGVMEVMLIHNDKDGIRYGDKLAGTMVVDTPPRDGGHS